MEYRYIFSRLEELEQVQHGYFVTNKLLDYFAEENNKDRYDSTIKYLVNV